MSCTFHAFIEYYVDEVDGIDEIVYVGDRDFDMAASGWGYVYKLIDYGNFLCGTEIYLPCYDYIDDACRVKESEMELVTPSDFLKILEAAKERISKLEVGANPKISDIDVLFTEKVSYEKQKELLIEYVNKLLELAREGLYFVAEKY